MPTTLLEYFKDYLPVFAKNTKGAVEITGENVFQKGNPELKKLIDSVIEKVMLPSSEFRHKENLEKFFDAVNAGKKGIILAEHYSNFDYPMLIYLMSKTGEKGAALAERCVGVAGLKLGEDNKYIASFTEGYDRLFIYPSRYIKAIENPDVREIEIKRSKQINIASMRVLEKLKKEGRVVVVYPAGTRYRPGQPETKRGVKEIDSYIKMSDIMLLVSVNGNCLTISETGNMGDDLVCEDRMILDASAVIDCTEFRESIKADNIGLEGLEKKQAVVDRVMEILEEMHEENEKDRLNPGR
ncbi:1-acyl-sn-glycerol-3-phosphate acyltransferase [Treponema pedis]|uniref:1-acyl-sn-glycerol-3-phosphate acyltransferase n=2 Tax=Treponema pedis TaxID=409322 RepID=A0A7S7AVV8_9SPIR|nr:1-acyl-sn-glycerol-3-phosphate acyltransferase [Treponema pedis]QOW60277.1 1-acyl-sn-glycerol-3-phosphate acyltransferase [Treponema pedis]QSI05622.1 1-acyl-sn-glycerol-3-phosphate acyltransferase [Treponema pedis]